MTEIAILSFCSTGNTGLKKVEEKEEETRQYLSTSPLSLPNFPNIKEVTRGDLFFLTFRASREDFFVNFVLYSARIAATR